MLVNSGIDYSHSRNLILSSVVLVLGVGMEVGEIKIPLGDYTVPGMALAAVVGVILNLILPAESKGLAVDSPDFGGELQAEAASAEQ
jgi:uracil permease